MDTGTKMDQVAAVSRLLSDAAESDEVVIQCHGTYTDGMYTTKRFTVSLCHRYNDAVIPLSEISADIDVQKQGHDFLPPTWAERIDALHSVAMERVAHMAAKAAEIVAAGKVTP